MAETPTYECATCGDIRKAICPKCMELHIEWEKQITQLKADLAKAEERIKYLKVCMGRSTTSWAKEVMDREADLAKHGGHTDECLWRRPPYSKGGSLWTQKCDCGWAEIEKEMNKWKT